MAALRWPRQASALSELRPGAECPCGHCVVAHHRTGRLVYKYAPSQPLTFPLGPGISVAMGQEPIWLNAAIDGGQNCLHTGGGDGRAGMGSVPTCLGFHWALRPFTVLKDEGGGGRAWAFSKTYCPLHCPGSDSINAPCFSWPSQPRLLQSSLNVPRAVALKPSSDLGAPEAHQFHSPSQSQEIPCHGLEGTLDAKMPLTDPLYWAAVPIPPCCERWPLMVYSYHFL